MVLHLLVLHFRVYNSSIGSQFFFSVQPHRLHIVSTVGAFLDDCSCLSESSRLGWIKGHLLD